MCLIDGGLKSFVKLNKMRNEGGTLGGRGWGLENQRNLIRSDGGLENQKSTLSHLAPTATLFIREPRNVCTHSFYKKLG